MAFKEIADQRYVTVSELATGLNVGRRHANLSSAIRLFVLDYYRSQAALITPAGHSSDSLGNSYPPR